MPHPVDLCHRQEDPRIRPRQVPCSRSGRDENCTPEHAAHVAKAIEFYTRVATQGRPPRRQAGGHAPKPQLAARARHERPAADGLHEGPRPTDAPRPRRATRRGFARPGARAFSTSTAADRGNARSTASGSSSSRPTTDAFEPWELENNEHGLTLVQPDADVDDKPPTAPRRAPPRRPRRRRLHRPHRARGGERARGAPAAPAVGFSVPLPAAATAADRQPPPHLTAEISPRPSRCRPAAGSDHRHDPGHGRPHRRGGRPPRPADDPLGARRDRAAPTREAATVDSHTLALLNSVATQEILETDAGPMRILHITADPRHELMAGTTRAGEATRTGAARPELRPDPGRLDHMRVLDTHTEWPDDRKEAHIAMRREMASAHARAEVLQRELDKQQTRKRARDDGAADGVGGAVVIGSTSSSTSSTRGAGPPTRAPTSARPAAAADGSDDDDEEAASDRKTATTTRRRTCSDGTHTRAHTHPNHAVVVVVK